MCIRDSRYLFKKDETPFVMELPPYRVPTMRATLSHMWDRCAQYPEWFIYLEAYPVYETGNDKPKRVREYLRRSMFGKVY